MKIEIYADVLFFINFVMIFFIFFIVSKFSRTALKKINLIISSFLSSLMYCFMVLFLPFNKINNFFGIFIVMSVGIFICFKPINFKQFLKFFLFTNISSFFVGGISMFVFFYTNIGEAISNQIIFSLKNASIKVLIISIFITYILIKLFINWYKRIFFKRQSFYSIKLYKNGQKISLNALLDTGNSLYEPITKKPVIVAEFLAVKEILPDYLKVIYYEKDENNLERVLKNIDVNKFRLIPFSSVGKQNGMLLGINIDKVEIFAEKNIVFNNATVAICNFSFSKDGFYNALLNPEMLNC